MAIRKKMVIAPVKERRSNVSRTEAKKKASPATAASKDESGEGAGDRQFAEAAGTGNIEQIRDIIFGTQMRDYEKRFNRLEERLVKENTDMRDETLKRFDALEKYVKAEVASLSEQIDAEQEARVESLKDVSKELSDTAEDLGKKTGKLDERLTKSTRELRQQILEQSKGLTDEICRKNEQASDAIEKTAKELRTDKVDRSALSDLLSEMAMRLTDDLAVKLNLKDPGND